MSGLKHRKHQRGVALLMVISLLTMLTSVVVDFQFNSRIDLQLAINARDELQAEYNALSAMRMRALLVKQAAQLQGAVTGLLASMGVQGAVPPMGQILQMVPIECGLLSAITQVEGDEKMDLADMLAGASKDGDVKKGKDQADEGSSQGGGTLSDGEGFFPGECLATSTSEHTKVSINMLRNGLQNRSSQVMRLLLGLLMEPRLQRHFSEDDRNGSHAATPQELVGAMADWVDADKNDYLSPVSDEDRNYSRAKDSYKAKNAPFDSVAEVQLVFGMDDELYAMMKNHLTIYTDSTSMDLATTPLDRIVMWGLPAALQPGVSASQLANHPGFTDLWRTLNDLRQIGSMGSGTLNVQVLTTLLQQFGMSSIIDMAQLGQVFTDTPGTTWYTMEAEGRVGNATRRMRGVLQASEGQYYYMRIE